MLNTRWLYIQFLRSFFMIIISMIVISCQEKNDEEPVIEIIEDQEDDPVEVSYLLPDIDLSNWKVTLPIGNPTEVKPPEILNYATNETLKPFMYNDSINGALVFYTYPGASTTNSSYSRTELREQMVPGSNNTNWTFAQGGNMKGTLSMDDISKESDGDYHRTMVMQIHGRLTNEQRDLIGENDNNAPPMLKIYWQKGYIRAVVKALKDMAVSDKEILFTDAWTDGESYTFSQYVGFDKFTLEVKASDGRMEVILNENEMKVFEGVHIEKWGVFENYFKAGNYLVTKDEGAYAVVKYYDLKVTH